jgi:hypothetical protein
MKKAVGAESSEDYKYSLQKLMSIILTETHNISNVSSPGDEDHRQLRSLNKEVKVSEFLPESLNSWDVELRFRSGRIGYF